MQKRIGLAALGAWALSTGACTMKTTGDNEVGVVANWFTGVQQDVQGPGQTQFYAALITDFYTFSTKTQRLEMTATQDQGDRPGKDDLEFKTRDGNDVGVDVTVLYRIDPKRAPIILRRVAKNDWEVKEKVVRPLTRALPRDCLNELTSEEIYSDKKFKAQDCAVRELSKALEPLGLVCEGVTFADHRFHAAYQKAIIDKKVFDQMVNTNRSATESALREWEAALEKTRGDVEQKIAAENGAAKQRQLGADAYYFAKEKEAQALLSEKEASAKGIRRLNQAMAGAGGKTRVKLRIADALAGKRIVVLPAGGEGSAAFNKLDVNRLIEAAMAREVDSSARTPTTP